MSAQVLGDTAGSVHAVTVTLHGCLGFPDGLEVVPIVVFSGLEVMLTGCFLGDQVAC